MKKHKWQLEIKSKKVNFEDVLKNRGVSDMDEYLKPSAKAFYDPFLMKDMDKAVERIKTAVSNNEKICIYGDYDVDGICAVSILSRYFKSINANHTHYIPSRSSEGYGLNKAAIQKIKDDGAKLIVTVDCGITATREVEFCKELNLDIIITDHHQVPEIIPEATAVVNPHRKDCEYPYLELCGAGIAFKIVQALSKKAVYELYPYLEIASIATIADIVELTGENRAIVKYGFYSIKKNGFIAGIESLIKISGLDKEKLNSYSVGFMIAPRINASGRLSEAEKGLSLMLSDDRTFTDEISSVLNDINIERRKIEHEIYLQVKGKIESDKTYDKDKVLVIEGENWHEGVIGIVASKISEYYYKPCIIISVNDGIGKGSARSIDSYNLFEEIKKVSYLLEKFGGHSQAAGLSIKIENIQKLRLELNLNAETVLSSEDMIPVFKADGVLSEKNLNLTLAQKLDAMEPLGLKNRKALFIMQNAEIKNVRQIGHDGSHISGYVGDDRFIGFNLSCLVEDLKDNADKKIDILFSPEENFYKGYTNLQLNIKDYKFIKRISHSKSIEHIIDFLYTKIDEDLIIKNLKTWLSLDHTEFKADENTIYVSTLSDAYNEVSTTLEYENNFSSLYFTEDIARYNNLRYNNIIICDIFSFIEILNSEKFDLSKITEMWVDGTTESALQAFSLTEMEIGLFLKKLAVNKKSGISYERLAEYSFNQMFALKLCTKLFEEQGKIVLKRGTQGIVIETTDDEAEFNLTKSVLYGSYAKICKIMENIVDTFGAVEGKNGFKINNQSN